MKECPHCEGSGRIQHTDDSGTQPATCGICGGSGRVSDDYGRPQPAPEE